MCLEGQWHTLASYVQLWSAAFFGSGILRIVSANDCRGTNEENARYEQERNERPCNDWRVELRKKEGKKAANKDLWKQAAEGVG